MTNRVYVEVHNRGIVKADTVTVLLLLCDASPGLPALPGGYDANVRAGTAVGSAFTLVGVKTLYNVRAGVPQVAEFPLPSTMLPPPASLPGDSHYCLLALLHSAQDQYTATQTNVDLLTIGERKVGQKNLHIVPFVGTPPPPSPLRWAAFQLHGEVESVLLTDLILDARGYKGRIGLALPHSLQLRGDNENTLVNFKVEKDGHAKDEVEDWQERHRHDLHRLMAGGRYDHVKAKHMLEALEQTVGQPLLVAERGTAAEVRGLELPPGKSVTAFLAIEPPPNAKVGEQFQFRLLMRHQGRQAAHGGCTYSVQMLHHSKRQD